LGIKEKRHEKVKEGGCMERNIQIGNKWWKIMTIYSKEMKRCRRYNKRKQGRMYAHGRRKENPKTRWKMQRGRD
jgi:hypothetical protein